VDPNAGAAPPQQAPPIDVSTIPPEVKSYLESTFRDGYVPASDLSGLQSQLDKQIAEARNTADLKQTQLQAAQAQTQRAQALFSQYVQEVQAGTRQPHPNDIATFTLALQQAGNQVTYTKAQAAAQHRDWEQGHLAGFQGRIDREAAGDPGNGLPPIGREVIANDPDVQRLNRELIEIAQADARDLYKNPNHGARALATQQQLEARINQVAQMARLRAVAQPATQEMQLVQNNIAKQDARGVQTQALPGMAGLGGGYNPDAAWQQSVNAIAALHNTTADKAESDAKLYNEVYAHWVQGYDSAAKRS
jgi:hypothetical protein